MYTLTSLYLLSFERLLRGVLRHEEVGSCIVPQAGLGLWQVLQGSQHQRFRLLAQCVLWQGGHHLPLDGRPQEVC